MGARQAERRLALLDGTLISSVCRCNNFVFSGYNTWQPIEQASGLIGGMPSLEEQLDAAVENNFTVIRAFAFVVQEGYNMQLSDGTYNESLLVAMDEFVAASSTRGLKLIMALANNWNYNSNMSDTKYAPTSVHRACPPSLVNDHQLRPTTQSCTILPHAVMCICMHMCALAAASSGKSCRVVQSQALWAKIASYVHA